MGRDGYSSNLGCFCSKSRGRTTIRGLEEKHEGIRIRSTKKPCIALSVMSGTGLCLYLLVKVD